LTVINDSGADGSNKSADTIYGQARLGIFILMGVCIALSISLAMWVARSLPGRSVPQSKWHNG